MPVYSSDDDKSLYDRIDKLVSSVEIRRKVQFSTPTKVLIVNMLGAIKSDPSRYWSENESTRLQLYENMIKTLPKTLNQFLNDEQIIGKVTFYDAMHWLTQNLDSICPFQKLDNPTPLIPITIVEPVNAR